MTTESEEIEDFDFALASVGFFLVVFTAWAMFMGEMTFATVNVLLLAGVGIVNRIFHHFT